MICLASFTSSCKERLVGWIGSLDVLELGWKNKQPEQISVSRPSPLWPLHTPIHPIIHPPVLPHTTQPPVSTPMHSTSHKPHLSKHLSKHPLTHAPTSRTREEGDRPVQTVSPPERFGVVVWVQWANNHFSIGLVVGRHGPLNLYPTVLKSCGFHTAKIHEWSQQLFVQLQVRLKYCCNFTLNGDADNS